MTYVRYTDGRDRGYVKDIPFVDAQEMLSKGQALPVNFDEPDPLGFRELRLPVAGGEALPSPVGFVSPGEVNTLSNPAEASSEVPSGRTGHSSDKSAKAAGGLRFKRGLK
jgi:hypothetical protein